MSSNCTEWLEELELWVNEQAGGHDYLFLNARGTRTRLSTGINTIQSNAVVSFFDGKLDYSEKNRVFYGVLDQVFSDRQRSGNQFFDVNKTDKLYLEVFVDGRVRFELRNWDNYTGTFVGNCQNGLMYGFDADGDFWVIDLAQIWREG